MMAIARRRPAAPPVKLLLAGLAVAALGGSGWTALHFLAAPELPVNPTVWAAGESRKVAPDAAPDTRNSVWSGADRRVRLYGGRQEYVGFQVVVRAGRQPLSGVQVHHSSLRSAERAGAGVGVNLLTVGTGGESKDEVAGYARKVKTWWSSQPDSIRKNTELLTYVYDEPHDDEDYAAVAERARWIRSAVGKDLLLFLT